MPSESHGCLLAGGLSAKFRSASESNTVAFSGKPRATI